MQKQLVSYTLHFCVYGGNSGCSYCDACKRVFWGPKWQFGIGCRELGFNRGVEGAANGLSQKIKVKTDFLAYGLFYHHTNHDIDSRLSHHSLISAHDMYQTYVLCTKRSIDFFTYQSIAVSDTIRAAGSAPHLLPQAVNRSELKVWGRLLAAQPRSPSSSSFFYYNCFPESILQLLTINATLRDGLCSLLNSSACMISYLLH